MKMKNLTNIYFSFYFIFLGSGLDGERGDARSKTSHFAHKGTDTPSTGLQGLA